MRTIKRKLGTKQDAKSRVALMAALYNRRTQHGARDSIEQAIKSAASPEKAKYIESEWLKTLPMWANATREHSALLLQVTTTNPNEAFHRSLKSLAKITKLVIRPKYSLSGIISLIHQCAGQYSARAQKAAFDWSKRQLSATLDHPWLRLFPYPVQLLLLSEIKASDALIQSGAELRSLSHELSCDCVFTRSYWLPCRHVLHAYSLDILDKEPNWEAFATQFDESGFEIYITRGLVDPSDDHVDALSHDLETKLVTSEALEQIRSRFFELSDFANELDADEKERLLKRWKDELASFSSAFIGRSLSEWLNRSDEIILF